MTRPYLRKAPELLHLPAERLEPNEITQFYADKEAQTSKNQHELLQGWQKRELSLALLGNPNDCEAAISDEAYELAGASYEHFTAAIEQISNQSKVSVRHLVEAYLACAEESLFLARLANAQPSAEDLVNVHTRKVEIGGMAVAYFKQHQNADTKIAVAQALGHALLSRTQDFSYTPYTASTREQMGFAQAYFPPRESGLSIRARFQFEKKKKSIKPDQTVLLLNVGNALSNNVLPASVHGRADKNDFWSRPEGIGYGFKGLETELHTGEVSEVVARTTQHFMEIVDFYDGKHTAMHEKSDFYWPTTELSKEDWAGEYRTVG